MDPVYGYQAVNVESQLRFGSSLLYWMRHLIRLRKVHHVFGRGSMEFVKPENRKIFAFIREYDGETVLCVFNLSSYPQSAELDLSKHRGRTPVIMVGEAVFPSIEERPYPLAFGSYGFYWFLLK